MNMKRSEILSPIIALLTLSTLAINATAATNSSAVNAFGAATVKTNASSVAAANLPTVTVAENVPCGAATACMVVRDTSNKAIDLINKDVPEQMTNVVTSQFDFTLMTKYAMGNNWKMATPDQQAKLVSLFKQLLVYTYSTALSKFKGAKTNIISATVSTPYPKKPDLQKTAVVSQITLPNSSNNNPIKVEYDLANNTGTWKAYDIIIENASLVTTYRNQFNDVVQKSKISGLIKQLQDKVNSLQKAKSQAE